MEKSKRIILPGDVGPNRKTVLPNGEVVDRPPREDWAFKVVIDAGSGVGKSTLADKVGEDHDCLVIGRDELLWIAIEEFPELSKRIYDEVITGGEPGKKFAGRKCIDAALKGVEPLTKMDYRLFTYAGPYLDKYVAEIGRCLSAARDGDDIKNVIPKKFHSAIRKWPKQMTKGFILCLCKVDI